MTRSSPGRGPSRARPGTAYDGLSYKLSLKFPTGAPPPAACTGLHDLPALGVLPAARWDTADLSNRRLPFKHSCVMLACWQAAACQPVLLACRLDGNTDGRLSDGQKRVYAGFVCCAKWSSWCCAAADYPFKAPTVRFETACFHPNVDQYGNICLDILKARAALLAPDSA